MESCGFLQTSDSSHDLASDWLIFSSSCFPCYTFSTIWCRLSSSLLLLTHTLAPRQNSTLFHVSAHFYCCFCSYHDGSGEVIAAAAARCLTAQTHNILAHEPFLCALLAVCWGSFLCFESHLHTKQKSKEEEEKKIRRGGDEDVVIIKTTIYLIAAASVSMLRSSVHHAGTERWDASEPPSVSPSSSTESRRSSSRPPQAKTCMQSHCSCGADVARSSSCLRACQCANRALFQVA